MAYFVASGVRLALATVLDFIIRLRMTRAGHKWVFLLGGAFDYSEYGKACASHGWSLWLARLFWVSAILGILTLGVAVVSRFGLKERHRGVWCEIHPPFSALPSLPFLVYAANPS